MRFRQRTSRDLVPSTRGSAFRKVVCDGRSWYARAIKTHHDLRRKTRPGSAARVPTESTESRSPSEPTWKGPVL